MKTRCPRTAGWAESLAAAAGPATGAEGEPRASMLGTHREQRPQLPCWSATREAHVMGKRLLAGNYAQFYFCVPKPMW